MTLVTYCNLNPNISLPQFSKNSDTSRYSKSLTFRTVTNVRGNIAALTEQKDVECQYEIRLHSALVISSEYRLRFISFFRVDICIKVKNKNYKKNKNLKKKLKCKRNLKKKVLDSYLLDKQNALPVQRCS